MHEPSRTQLVPSEELFRALVQNSSDMISLVDADGTVVFQSPSIQRLLGYRPEDRIGHNVFSDPMVHPDDRTAQRMFFEKVRSTPGAALSEHFRLRHSDGSWRNFEAVGQNFLHDPAVVGIVANYRDITERKRAEEALRRANERLELATRGSNLAIWECDMPDGRIENSHQTYINVWESMGYDAATAPTDFFSRFAILFHPIDQERVMREIQELFDSDRQDYESEFRVRWKDGSTHWHLSRGTVLRDPDGKPIRFIGTSADITALKQAEEALRERERQLDSLMGHLPGLAYRALADEHWTALFASRGIEDLTGYSAEEFTSHRIHYEDIILPEDRTVTRKAVFSALRQRRMYEVEHRIRHKDGSVRWIWARGHGVFAPDGSLRFIEGLNLDMTSRKQAEEALRESEEALRISEQRFRTMASVVPVTIWTTAADGALDYVNAYLTDYTGFPLEHVLNGAWRTALHPDDLPRCLELWSRSIATGSLYEIEYRIRRADGVFRWHLSRGLPLRDDSGRIIKWFGSTMDIDDQKRAAEALREAKEAAESANRAKDEFLANVSHEIRTPMNAILGMAELTLDTPLTDEQRNNLNVVLSSAEGLLNLINDLLDFSKIEAGRLEMEEADFSLRTVLNQTLRALALRAHKKGMELACQVEQEVPDGLVGDGKRLRQVVLNLIGNAIKFTEAGEVIVRVRAQETNSQAVVLDFEIADTGIGIAPEKQQTIFQAFEQADSSTTRRYGGTGLGLTISSRLVEMMGGKIAVESQLGRGSTFRFGARFGRSSRLAAAPAQPPVVDLHGLRVLIVDDNATNRTILQGWASAWGMTPAATADVPAAMSALWRGVASREPFALVLLDARMPGTNGLELAKEISQTPELSTCRIILLTSDDRPADAKRYRALRISAVLMKPVQQEELLDNIYRVLSHGAVGTEIPESMQTTEPDNARDPAVRAAAESSSPRLQVLVAEDNRFNQLVIQRMLERRGHTVRVVPDGSEALAALEQSTFDLLLLDVNMPEMDGFEVIRAVRERERTSGKHLRVIALTALSGTVDRHRCIEGGMDDFLVKPVRAAEVYAALERVIKVYPAAESETSAPISSVIDPPTLWGACGGDGALLFELIQMFQEEWPRLLGRVEAAVHSANAGQLRTAAHAARGLVAFFSNSAAKACETLEQMGIDGRPGDANEPYQALSQAVQDLRAVLPNLTIENLRARMRTGS